MRNGESRGWRSMLLLAGLLALGCTAWAQARLTPEVELNNVTLNSTFVEVLTRHGIPHYIGPAVTGADTITSLLSSQPMPKTGPGAAGTPGGPGAGGMYPGAMGGGDDPMGGAARGGGLGAGAGISLVGPDGLPKPEEKKKQYMIWRYDGKGPVPDARAGYSMYVFFNERGTVEGVVVVQTGLRVTENIRTDSGFGFGAKMFDIVKRYEWPDPLARIGSLYFCNYPAYNVTFALDGESRKVLCIGIGLPLAVLEQKSADLIMITPISPVSSGNRPGALLGPMGRGGLARPDSFAPDSAMPGRRRLMDNELPAGTFGGRVAP